MGQNSDDSDGRVLLLVHDMESQSGEQFWEDLNHLRSFEVFGGVGHNHWDWLFQEMEESSFLVPFS